ncbi:fibronectin type III domain-containing protein [Actinotalea sp. BY-33]|uniref:Fibronectin type III domain-containing protein n=1 Tax=Actinotalea soli TaxID=2819234 RepID=A0A939RVH7_9CELL|nr:fibronectin type III domain-containing protein [Actinotalea soli]MBO1752410.1 fibronectin type III domain-containing protein [Actinotalea soli]
MTVQVEVMAYSGAGDGAVRASQVVTLTRASEPSEVGDISISVPDDLSRLDASWGRPDNGGSRITEYVVELNTGGGWSVIGRPGQPSIQYPFSAGQVAYRQTILVRVSAVNEVGTGASKTQDYRLPDPPDPDPGDGDGG